MTARFPPFAFVELVSPHNKKNITRWLEDMNFMFSWQEHKIHIFEPTCNILYICMCQFLRSVRRILSLEELHNVICLSGLGLLHESGWALGNESNQQIFTTTYLPLLLTTTYYYLLISRSSLPSVATVNVQYLNESITTCLWLNTTKTIHQFYCLSSRP